MSVGRREPGEQLSLNQGADLLNSVISAAAARSGFEFVAAGYEAYAAAVSPARLR